MSGNGPLLRVARPAGSPLPPLSASGLRHRRLQRPWWRVPILWTVYGYIVGEVTRVVILSALAISLLYSVLAAYQTVRSGLQLNFIWPLMTKTFAYPLYYSIPLSFLFAITLALGRMVNDLEVAALRTHGVSHLQVFLPVMVLGGVLCAASFHLNGWVVPNIHYEKRNLQSYILKQLENLGSGANRTILLPDEAGSLWVGAYDGTDIWQVDIDLQLNSRSQLVPKIREHLPEKLPAKVKVLAREGHLELYPERMAVVLNLRGVDVLVPEPVRTAAVANERFHQMFTIAENVVIPLSFAPKSPSTKDRTHPELLRHIRELRDEIRRLKLMEKESLAHAAYHAEPAEKDRPQVEAQDAGLPWREKSRKTAERRLASARTELHRRVAFSLTCLTFPLVGISLTLLLDRWSRLMPFLCANLVVIGLFYPLLMVGVALGEAGFLPPVAMALPNVALLALGIHLTRKVVRR